jgi:hypothetical protein
VNGPSRGRDRATDTKTLTIEVLPPEAPTITTEALSTGTVGEFYCGGNLFASGGGQPYWSLVARALPPGLPLPKSENTISGTPTTAGTFTFTVRVTEDLDAFSESSSPSRSSEHQAAVWIAAASCRCWCLTSAISMRRCGREGNVLQRCQGDCATSRFGTRTVPAAGRCCDRLLR